MAYPDTPCQLLLELLRVTSLLDDKQENKQACLMPNEKTNNHKKERIYVVRQFSYIHEQRGGLFINLKKGLQSISSLLEISHRSTNSLFGVLWLIHDRNVHSHSSMKVWLSSFMKKGKSAGSVMGGLEMIAMRLACCV